MLRRTFSLVPVTLPLTLVLLTLFALWSAAPAFANGVVSNCSNDSQLSSLLAVGGTITFACGTATIPLSSTKTISSATVLIGADQITLAGNHSFRLFQVNSGASLDLQHITLDSGYSSNGNGGAVLNNGFLALDFMTIQHTGASGFDGGAVATTGTADITGVTFANNQAGRGGAIYASGQNAVVSISASHFNNNTVASNVQGSNRGGALYAENGAQVTVGSSTFDSNSGGTGGAIYNTATLSIIGSTFSNNTAQSLGGGVGNEGTATISTSNLNANTGPLGGGGIVNYGNFTVTSSTFTGNKELNGGYGGGAIDNRGGKLIVNTSSFIGNTAGGGAAAIETAFGGSASITNVTMSGNIAGDSGGAGGGFYNFKSTATLTNVTITGGHATTGGGVSNANETDSHMTLKNVLIANSTGGGNCDFAKAPDLSLDNLSSDNSCSFGGGRDNANPLLGPLELGGGSTFTERLLPGSPAIDAGANIACPNADQRGVPRIQGSDCDVGATEFVPCASKPTASQIVSPVQGAQVKAGQVLFDWVGPDCATKFKLVVRQGKSTNPNFFKKKVFPATQISTNLPKKKYFWQLKACNSAGCTASPFIQFKVTK